MTERDRPPPGYKTQSSDTSYWAERMQIEHWRGLAPWEKARRIDQLAKAAHDWHMAGWRMRYPDASERELELRAAALRLGDEVVLRWTGFDARR